MKSILLVIIIASLFFLACYRPKQTFVSVPRHSEVVEEFKRPETLFRRLKEHYEKERGVTTYLLPGTAISLRLSAPSLQKIPSSGCGHYAIATVLENYGFGVNPSLLSLPAPMRITEAIEELSAYFAVEQRNGGSFQDLMKQIDSGYPAIVLIQCVAGEPNYAVLTGYEISSTRSPLAWRIIDSSWGNCGPFILSHEKFKAIWKSTGSLLAPNPRSNFWIALGPK